MGHPGITIWLSIRVKLFLFVLLSYNFTVICTFLYFIYIVLPNKEQTTNFAINAPYTIKNKQEQKQNKANMSNSVQIWCFLGQDFQTNNFIDTFNLGTLSLTIRNNNPRTHRYT